MMVGREITQFFPKIQVDIGDAILEVKNFSLKGKFHDISFEVRRGEILGIAGLVGSGRSELMQSIFGVIPPDRGEVYKNKQRINIRSPEDAIRHGIAFLTEDRKRSGLFLPLSVLDNMIMPNLEKFEKWFFVSDRLACAVCENLRKELDIKTPTLYQIVRNLSGGNQQKVVLARWLMRDAEILILDEPTKGIDVGAKAEIHYLMSRLAGQGKAIIMISSEMPEILGMSDRILVMHDGRITGVLDRKEANQEKVMALALS
jgi:inositol transport system ATP-binding protein